MVYQNNINNETKSALIDWVSITFNHFDIVSHHGDYHFINIAEDLKIFIDLFKSDSRTLHYSKGVNGYKQCIIFGEHIRLNFGGEYTMNSNGNYTCQLLMSGQACREFETYMTGDYKTLFNYALSNNAVFNRLDVAIDDFTAKEIDIYDIERYIRKNHFISPMTDVIFNIGIKAKRTGINSKGYSITFGTPGGTQLQIYDKLLERQSKNENTFNRNLWYRYEMRLKKEKAEDIAKHYVAMVEDNKYNDFTELASNLLYSLLDIKEFNLEDSNISRWDTLGKWIKFLDSVSKIKFTSKDKVESTLEKRKIWYSRSIKSVNAEFYLANQKEFNIYLLEDIRDSLREILVESDAQKLSRVNIDRKNKGLSELTFADVEYELKRLDNFLNEKKI